MRVFKFNNRQKSLPCLEKDDLTAETMGRDSDMAKNSRYILKAEGKFRFFLKCCSLCKLEKKHSSSNIIVGRCKKQDGCVKYLAKGSRVLAAKENCVVQKRLMEKVTVWQSRSRYTRNIMQQYEENIPEMGYCLWTLLQDDTQTVPN